MVLICDVRYIEALYKKVPQTPSPQLLSSEPIGPSFQSTCNKFPWRQTLPNKTKNVKYIYPLAFCHIAVEAMAVEIMSFPINSIVIVHSYGDFP